jgi:hypothetical protein
MRICNPEPNESGYWLDFSEHLPKAVAREDHMMTSGERSMAAGMARPRAAAKLPQNVAVISAPSCLERPRQGNKTFITGDFSVLQDRNRKRWGTVTFYLSY